MDIFGDPAQWLPLTFAGLMGLSILIYVVLDGFDLGVGLLFPFADEAEKDRMIASIGPFWDANETWLVMAVGLLLVAFPTAHGIILTALYLPVAVMLVGLILRGVAFEFRAKAPPAHKRAWNMAFFTGSLMAALSQGWMLGIYVMGLETTWATATFAALTALFLTVGYSYIGAAWVVLKSDSALQTKAVGWARGGIFGVLLGIAAISVASPLASPRIFDKWFSFPEALLLLPLPLMSGIVLLALWFTLARLPKADDSFAWVPFAAGVVLFALAFFGLAYSFYPYVVPDQLTIYEAASAPESLFIIFLGVCIVLPVIVLYSALAYTVFRGKATELRYD
ncbi:cytochrome d ubiquinol oxidase subunit II [Pseudaestuariivita atlantica]|uniref:Cytochrome BD ubiquinol oxidase subunit II n=1 Tax=Pseudaestuariivita atlantica TaxID=1317121 RepID=A0A0L1JMZ5_9RHOB|nr:cytochrome d ubiquinol oxidase subunit II [Pseudaestuariivita atlantica]KNG93126.1 cytochrome BD ubiquinol oxidase subunit II [Pseudaestuariivita atlantica]